ncbi:MAG: hypothetical protein L0331_31145, partial [Chloroflexi bacterium]|nr:hypothetical protein [Chloroflexota bacterium]
MGRDLKQALSHVLWIGGATDSGKTTATERIAERYGCQLYHYDRHDPRQMERLAETEPRYRAFLNASMDERWVYPEPEELLRRAWQSFQDRFPLVVEDLLGLPQAPMIVAEGFGLLPGLLVPVLASKRQAIWLVPTEAFKWASMERRNKPSFREEVSDPERARMNLFRRDMLLAERVREQVEAYGLTMVEVDGSRAAGEMVTLIEQHFAPFLLNR